MPSAAPGGTTINRVRLLRAGREPLAARLRAERAITAAVQAPPLPPAAILCVKRLRASLPGSVPPDSMETMPHRWMQAVGAELSECARRAARPARDAIAGDPEAILFDDSAQMLACLAADWSAGLASSRWWWRALVGNASDIQHVLRTWLARPQHIAAALEEMAVRGAAIAFVRRLTPGGTRLLLDAVLATHDLAPLAAVIRTPAPALPMPPPRREEASGRTAAVNAPAMPTASIPAPWADAAAEAEHMALRVDQALLLGVVLTVRRQPVVARRQRFAAGVQAWLAGRARRQDPFSTRDPARPVVSPSAVQRVESRLVDGLSPPAVETARDEASASDCDVPLEALVTVTAPRAAAPDDEDVRHLLPWREPRPEVQTELGGLFYLLNVAIALGYYGDFTAPAYRGLDCSIWDFVRVTGRALLRQGIDDPIWALLATLAGRAPDEAPDRATVRRIQRLVPQVRARLAAALGTRRALAALVCRHRARILITATHIDMLFSLAELPIAIRISGLDRDPGWIPAADRIVTFHFN